MTIEGIVMLAYIEIPKKTGNYKKKAAYSVAFFLLITLNTCNQK